MEAQKRIFTIAKNKLSPQFRLADVIAELLNIGTDSAYRRLRGEKELTIRELQKICSHFSISMDEIWNQRSSGITFRYSSLDIVSNSTNYYNYMVQFTQAIEHLAKSQSKEILFTAEDIPIFHFMPYPELIFFKLYAWYQTICNLPISYDKFVEELEEKDKLLDCYKKIMDGYNHIPSTEIWTYNTIDPVLRLLEYYYDLDRFEDKEIPKLLCTQLLEMIETVSLWTEIKKKGPKSISDFNLYLSPVNPENSFMISKCNGTATATIKLFTINSLVTSDSSFCNETEKWIHNTISKSTFLSGVSARERFRFFQQLKNRINNLAEKFEK